MLDLLELLDLQDLLDLLSVEPEPGNEERNQFVDRIRFDGDRLAGCYVVEAIERTSSMENSADEIVP